MSTLLQISDAAIDRYVAAAERVRDALAGDERRGADLVLAVLRAVKA